MSGGVGDPSAEEGQGAVAPAPGEPTQIRIPAPRDVSPEPDAATRLGLDPRLGQHLGVIGRLVGGGPEKAGNIAFVVILAAFLVLAAAVVLGAAVDTDKVAEAMHFIAAGCLSLITGAIGYIFGAKRD